MERVCSVCVVICRASFAHQDDERKMMSADLWRGLGLAVKWLGYAGRPAGNQDSSKISQAPIVERV